MIVAVKYLHLLPLMMLCGYSLGFGIKGSPKMINCIMVVVSLQVVFAGGCFYSSPDCIHPELGEVKAILFGALAVLTSYI